MNREYDIFECLPDGSVKWRGTVVGLAEARLRLEDLAGAENNDHFAIHLPTRQVVFRADALRKTVVTAKSIFQIAYDETLRQKRAEVLRSRGYGVISVIGNEAAKALLDALRLADHEIALFMVGHGAPVQTRNDIVNWLKDRFPEARILALNPPNQQVPLADYNVIQNGPELWLPLLAHLPDAQRA